MLALHLQCQNILNFTYTNIACIVLALHLQCQNIVDISAYIYYFHNVGAAFAVPKSLKFYLYEYRLYCAGAAFAVPKYSDFTSMNIVCMLALHLQCQNF